MIDFGNDVPFGVALFIGVRDYLCDAEGFGMEGCLGDKTIGEGNSQETCYTSCESQEEEVPVKAGGFTEGELCSLSYEGGD